MHAYDPPYRKQVQSREKHKIQNENVNTKPRGRLRRVGARFVLHAEPSSGVAFECTLCERGACVCAQRRTLARPHCERGWWVASERVWDELYGCCWKYVSEWVRRKLESPITSSPWAQRCSLALLSIAHTPKHTQRYENTMGLRGALFVAACARVYLPHSTPRAECERAMIC